MKNKALLFALATLVLAIGCGGGGGDSNGGTNGGTNTGTTATTGGVPGAGPGDSQIMVNLPNTRHGRVNVAYVPRQGRAGEIARVILHDLELARGADVFLDQHEPEIRFDLTGSEVQQRSSSLPVPLGSSSRFFDTFVLSIESFFYDPTPGVAGDELTFANPLTGEPFIREPFPARIRVLPARETTLEVRLNDAMIEVDMGDPENGVPPSASFNREQFEFENFRTSPRLEGFISDFLMFDISGMGNERPTMSNGQQASRVYFSGDRFGMSAAGPGGYFEMLTLTTQPMQGEFTDPILIGTTPTPGVWRTLVPDPNDPSPTPGKITALLGIFRPFFDERFPDRSMVLNPSDFDVLLLPTSDDNDNMQIVLVARSGQRATNLYWGNADLSTGTFVAYPIGNLTTGSVAGAINGTLTAYLDASGTAVGVPTPSDATRVRYGRYALGGTLPPGFRSSGRFIVFRR